MARSSEQMGIRFLVNVSPTGYTWNTFREVRGDIETGTPIVGDAETLLQVCTEHPVRRMLDEGPWIVNRQTGLGVARQAFNAFTRLAEDIAPQFRSDMIDVEGAEAREAYMRLRVVEFANKYGSLYSAMPHQFNADDHGQTLQEWRQIAREFLALLDVSKAIQSGDFRAFERRTSRLLLPKVGPAYYYLGREECGVFMSIAKEGAGLRNNERVLLAIEEADRRGAGYRARMLLGNEVNRRLEGGLSMAVDTFDPGIPWVKPRNLVAMLFARLWIDTLRNQGKAIEQVRQCIECGNDIPEGATRRRKYCSDQCKDTFNNRRRAR